LPAGQLFPARRPGFREIGTIVIPVLIEAGGDPEVALEDSAFKLVWDVLEAGVPTTKPRTPRGSSPPTGLPG
jgi:hypothetical protein